MSEFDLINRYFSKIGAQRPDTVLSVGDDAALLNVPEGHTLVVSVDTLVAGVHFPLDTRARDIGYKALAVNLSDIAAMAADPAWATLALTLPEHDDAWLSEFALGFAEAAKPFGVQLVGGDTTCGPLTITVQIMGYVRQRECLRRDGARPGDLIYVTGEIGDGGAGLAVVQGRATTSAEHAQFLRARLNRPTPRVTVGRLMRGIATAAIDISDGLLADLNHVLERSCVGATVGVDRVPVSPAAASVSDALGGWETLLTAGDDYELCLVVPKMRQRALEALAPRLGCACTLIGEIETQRGLRLVGREGVQLHRQRLGYEHF